MACAVAALAGTAVAAPPTEPVERLVKDIPLQAFFHTRHAWQLKIYEQPDAISLAVSTGNARQMRVCFVFPPVPNESPPSCWSGAFQKLDSVKLRLAPGPDGKMDRPVVVIRATGQTGPTVHGTTHGLITWMHYSFGEFGVALHSTVNISGEQKFMEAGPLAGTFIRINEVREGDEQTEASPRHYEMDVYEPVRFGYIKVLSVLSKNRYPSPLAAAVLSHPIATLTPEMVRDLSAVYPHGVYALAVQR